MATRRLRPEDWAPVAPTRIQIRATPSQGPRDERVRLPKCAQKPPRPRPVNYAPGESPPIPKGHDGLESDSPPAPEVVDFAAPSTWPRRGLPPHVASSQRQQWDRKRVVSPSTVSRYSSRQSGVSFGILDYYTRDPSPTASPTLPPTPMIPQTAQVPRKVEPQVIDPATEELDFGLPVKTQKPQSQVPNEDRDFAPPTTANDVTAGAQQHDEESATRPAPPPQTEKVEPAKPIYSLFPKDTTPPSRPPHPAPSHQDIHENVATSTTPHLPPHQAPDPSYRPRKQSLSSSLRSRKDSCTSHRTHAPRIPLRVFSGSSTTSTTASVRATPRTSHALPDVRTSSSSSSTATATATASPPWASGPRCTTESRWSEDTVASPTVAAFSGRGRTSFGSLLRGGVEDEVGGGQYPACFFEDDDDEAAPLRRKLKWGGRGGSWQDFRRGMKGGRAEGQGPWGTGGSGWQRILLCGCGG